MRLSVRAELEDALCERRALRELEWKVAYLTFERPLFRFPIVHDQSQNGEGGESLEHAHGTGDGRPLDASGASASTSVDCSGHAYLSGVHITPPGNSAHRGIQRRRGNPQCGCAGSEAGEREDIVDLHLWKVHLDLIHDWRVRRRRCVCPPSSRRSPSSAVHLSEICERGPRVTAAQTLLNDLGTCLRAQL